MPEEGGLPRDVTSKTKIVQFNDPEALRAALEPRDVAIVITEPTMTNNVGLLLPEPGFHDALRAITRETGTVLLLRRDAHAGRRPRRAHEDVVAASPTW